MRPVRILLALIVPFLFLAQSPGFAAEPQQPPAQTSETATQEIPIEIFADEITHFKEKDRILARGRVQIKYQDRFLFADQVDMNTKTGFGEARGNVFFKDENEETRCSRAEFNIEKKTGILFETKAFLQGQYRIEGKEFEKYGENRFRAAEATMTTCDGPLPFWSICAKELDGEQEGYMTMRHSTFNIKGVPVLYLPFWYASVASKRKSGFLMPEYQYGSNDGSSVKVPYYWAINQSQDVTFYLSHLANKGFKPEAEYRYVLDESSKGKMRGLYLKEKDTNRTFWNFGYTHNQEFKDNVRVFGTGFLQDRTNVYTKEFSTKIEDQAVRSSYADANLSKEWENFSFLAQTSYEQGLQFNSNQTLKTLPSLKLLGYQHRLGESPFFVALDSSLNYIEEKRGRDKNYSKRVDFRPSLIFNQSFFPWANLTASATALTTYYQQSLQSGNAPDRLRFARKLYHLSSTLRGPSLSKSYGNDFKHIVDPFVEYNFIPNLEKTDRSRISIYDQLDALSNMNKFTYGLNNTVIGYFKEGETYAPKKVMNLLIQQSYKLDNAPGLKVSPFDNIFSDIERNGVGSYVVPTVTERKFSNVYGKMDLFFANNYTLIADTELAYDRLSADKYNISLERSVDDNTLTLAKRFTRSYNNYWSVGVSQLVYDKWRLHYQNGYSELEKKILFHMVGFDYMEQCWGVSAGYLRKSTIIDSVHQDNNRVTLLVNFRGLGSIGQNN